MSQKTAEIHCSDGSVVIVDADDYEFLSKFRWHRATRGYATATISMHRLIVGAPVGKEVDHINGEPADNRKENLRLCTRSQNIANTRKPRRKNGCQSRYKGVHWAKTNKKWVAIVAPNGKRYRRYCDTELEAAKAYDEMAKRHFGEFARLNFQ